MELSPHLGKGISKLKRSSERGISWIKSSILGEEQASGSDDQSPDLSLGIDQANRQSTSAQELAIEINRLLEEVDYRYTAGQAVNGAKYGKSTGPYGAILGAGLGTIHGAYNSSRDAFNSHDPEGLFEKDLDLEAELDKIGYAGAGFRFGKRFGIKGQLAGATIGGGLGIIFDDTTTFQTVTEVSKNLLTPQTANGSFAQSMQVEEDDEKIE